MASTTLKSIQLKEIKRSGFNPRTPKKSDPDIKELVQSIQASGLRIPILVRPTNGHFEVVDGERRLVALRCLDNYTVVQCNVREMDDREAKETIIIAHLQHQDLRPLEEASGVAELIEDGWTYEQVANQLGKSATWVARRASLTKLSAAWIKAINDPKQGVSRWSADHFELVARMPEDVQAKILENNLVESKNDTFKFNSVAVIPLRELATSIGSQFHLLSLAKWNLDDDKVARDAGSCTDCMKRSDKQPLLFDSPKSNSKKPKDNTQCLDKECWDHKAKAHLARRKKLLKAEHGDNLVILNDWEGAIVEHCKASAAGATPCFIIKGDKAGTFFWGKPSETMLAKQRSRKTVADKTSPLATLAELRSGLQLDRDKLVLEKVEDAFGELAKETREGPDLGLNEMAWLAMVFGVYAKNSLAGLSKRWTMYDDLASSDAELLPAAFVPCVAEAILDGSIPYEPLSGDKLIALTRLCEMFNIDLAAFIQEAAETHPEPAEWANLKADGTPKKAKKGKKAEAGT